MTETENKVWHSSSRKLAFSARLEFLMTFRIVIQLTGVALGLLLSCGMLIGVRMHPLAREVMISAGASEQYVSSLY